MKQMLLAVSVNKGCCLQYQAITLQLTGRWALRKLRIETGCCYGATSLYSHPQQCAPWRLRMGKHKILAPKSCVHIKGTMSRSPDFCIFPHIKRALTSVTWDIWFSLTEIFWSSYLVFVAKAPIYPGFPLSPWSNLSELSERLHSGLKSSVLSTNIILNL